MKILDTGIKTAKENMEIDHALLESLTPTSTPILHFYQWKHESATFGYFIKIDSFLDLEKIKKWKIDLARRPTGGGIVFHSWDLAFSVLLPSGHPKFSQNPLQNYLYINSLVLEAVRSFFSIKDFSLLPSEKEGEKGINFCMAKPSKYDVILGGKKIAGAAQRKKRQGLLHQGTISIASPKEHILLDVLKEPSLAKKMREMSFTLLQENWTSSELEDARHMLCFALKDVFTNHTSGHMPQPVL